jgi:hypothetical protein
MYGVSPRPGQADGAAFFVIDGKPYDIAVRIDAVDM